MNTLVEELLGETSQNSEDLPLNVDNSEDLLGNAGDQNLNNDETSPFSEAADEAALEEFANAQNFLAEQMNVIRLNKQTRLLNLTNRSALILAKRANDPLYDKYAKFNALRLQFRAAIVKKYGSKAASYARQIMSKSTTASGPKK